MYEVFSKFLASAEKICVIQAENPDGDSIGSALALSEILKNKTVSLYCPVNIPRYIRYFENWGMISDEFDFRADCYIIVDTASKILLSKLLDDPAIENSLEKKPVLVLDHHETPDDLPFQHEKIIEILPSCCNLIFKIARDQGLEINPLSAEDLLAGIESDTLGLTSASTTADTFFDCAELIRLGANISDLEERRREFMKKSPRILDYKADLIKKVEYHLDGTLATVHIPWEEIREYSDEYNPNALIMEELRLVEGVKAAVSIKTYPDGKVTGKVRTANGFPYAERIAGFFGGGGHPYASGFRTYDANYEDVVKDLVQLMVEIEKESERS